MADALDKIRAANEEFMKAFKRGDAAGVAGLYTDGARLLPPNSEMLTGKAAIESFWRGAMEMGIKEARLETVSVDERQDLAVEVGRYKVSIQPEGGEAVTDTGKYVVVWKDEGGGWKLHVDIWNTSAQA